jgi:hypothetical protein
MTIRTTRRATLAGLAVTAATALPDAPPPSELDRLMDEHRRASAAFLRAIDDLEEAEAAFATARPEGLMVPDGCGNFVKVDPTCRETAKQKATQTFSVARALMSRAILEEIVPGLVADTVKAIDDKERETLAEVDAIFDREAASLEAAERRRDETSDADDAALLAICSYPCATMGEVRRKASYLAGTPAIKDFADNNTMALLASLIEPGT